MADAIVYDIVVTESGTSQLVNFIPASQTTQMIPIGATNMNEAVQVDLPMDVFSPATIVIRPFTPLRIKLARERPRRITRSRLQKPI